MSLRANLDHLLSGATVFVNKDGRTQVPLRFIAELLGWDVKWT
ncbi:stalk domain-containing protein [Paenibacillus pabuli]